MRHLPTAAMIAAWPEFTVDRPLRVFSSGCLAGQPCGVDGTSYGVYPSAAALLAMPNVKVAHFCPEDFSFGTPRAMPNIYGGNGYDVLAGNARVKTDEGEDWTDGMVRAAHRMLELALA